MLGVSRLGLNANVHPLPFIARLVHAPNNLGHFSIPLVFKAHRVANPRQVFHPPVDNALLIKVSMNFVHRVSSKIAG